MLFTLESPLIHVWIELQVNWLNQKCSKTAREKLGRPLPTAPENGDDALLQQSHGRRQDAAAGQLSQHAAAQPQDRPSLIFCR